MVTFLFLLSYGACMYGALLPIMTGTGLGLGKTFVPYPATHFECLSFGIDVRDKLHTEEASFLHRLVGDGLEQSIRFDAGLSNESV